MRYFTQAISEDDPKRKDMLLDIATEELSHLEVIGSIVSMLCKGAHPEQQAPVDSGGGRDGDVVVAESELAAKVASRTVSKTRTRVDSRKIAVG
jgi:Mn-containing catalase